MAYSNKVIKHMLHIIQIQKLDRSPLQSLIRPEPHFNTLLTYGALFGSISLH